MSTEFSSVTSPCVSQSSPVAIFIFNRPEHTSRLIEAIRNANISILFVVADGPRPNNKIDEELCSQSRALIDNENWKFKVVRQYRPENLGCGVSVSRGLDWVFSQVDQCIILEDDCIPTPTFFPYCTELLDRYRYDDGVMIISGDNYLMHQHIMDTSYTFSVYSLIHGWATWRRAWEKYDFYMKDWPALRSMAWLKNLLGNRRYAQSWIDNFDLAYRESNANQKCVFWDIQLMYACWKNNVVNIIPSVNLISNIGYGESATMTFDGDHPLAELETEEMMFPLRHPELISRDYRVDNILKITSFGYKPLYIKVCRKIRKILGL
jgi:hypothetical protein